MMKRLITRLKGEADLKLLVSSLSFDKLDCTLGLSM